MPPQKPWRVTLVLGQDLTYTHRDRGEEETALWAQGSGDSAGQTNPETPTRTERALEALAVSAMGRPRKDKAEREAKWELGRTLPRPIKPMPPPPPRTGTARNWRDDHWETANVLIYRHIFKDSQNKLGVSENYARALGCRIQRLQKKKKKQVELELEHNGLKSTLTCVGTIRLKTERVDQAPAAERNAYVWKGENIAFDMIVDPGVAGQYVTEEASSTTNAPLNPTSSVVPGPIPGNVTPSILSPEQDTVSRDYSLPSHEASPRTTTPMPHRRTQPDSSLSQVSNSDFTYDPALTFDSEFTHEQPMNPTAQDERNARNGQSSDYHMPNPTHYGFNFGYDQPSTSTVNHGQSLMPNGYCGGNSQTFTSTFAPGTMPVEDMNVDHSQMANPPMFYQPELAVSFNYPNAFQSTIFGNLQDLNRVASANADVYLQAAPFEEGLSPTGAAGNVPGNDGSGSGAQILRSLDRLDSEAWASAELRPALAGETFFTETGSFMEETGLVEDGSQFIESFSDLLNREYDTPEPDV
ncbi:hypothetical protein AK830_g5624 [Neonectria ditissima]|uniref:Uncharacterized protein n=1 Tax=Neonectria ditissima TaxID=78410 RepID=A0A0P7ASY1_9HYPO|nr:hypothetical protein AK830_g5624 [Neonectria ditissima]